MTAFYGILAIATAYPLNSTQLSMYSFSLVSLALTLYLAPHIRNGSAWHCLAFAQSYILDGVVNALYTVLFAMTWFTVLAAGGLDASTAPGAETIDATAGFTSPEHNVSQVDVVASPASGLAAGQEAVAIGTGVGSLPSEGLYAAIFNSDSMMSLVVIAAFLALRVYATLVVMAYARQALRQQIQLSAASNWQLYSGSKSSDVAENPFAENKEEGKGWKGKVGRFMVNVGRDYWLGRDDEEDMWIGMVGGKFRKSGEHDRNLERERRRRSGTDPPLPSKGLLSPA